MDKYIDSPIAGDGGRNRDISIGGGKGERRRDTEKGRG